MGINQKLDTHYNGSSQNLEQYRPKLKLPADSWTWPVFHVSKLKKVIGDYSLKAALPKELEVGVGRFSCVLASREIIKCIIKCDYPIRQ
jgi:hypothetical protein